MDYDEREKASRGMVKYGGGFISHLGRALYFADMKNAAKIKAAWPKEWAKYAKIGGHDGTVARSNGGDGEDRA